MLNSLNTLKTNLVSIVRSKNKSYPVAPFHPDRVFPEFSDFNLFRFHRDPANDIYASVRQVLIDLELDKENIDTKKWNPLKSLIGKGQHVVIKPNLVRHCHPLGQSGVISMITHASVIRPMVDYALLATGGDVRITICDVPLQQTKWDEMISINGLKALVDFYKKNGVKVNLLDLRLDIALTNEEGIIIKRDRKIRDPLGYSPIDLGDKSALMPIIKHCKKFEITDYGSGTVPEHHNSDKNEYLVPNTILNADLFINAPKLKTHRKAGITFALKNLIGINGDKSWLAHHRSGSIKRGGDEYDKLNLKMWFKWHLWAFLKKSTIGIFIAKILKKFFRKFVWKGKDLHEIKMEGKKEPVTEGSWHGNDTVWRCVKDLNNILFFADKKGEMQTDRQRNYLCIGDGIIAGDREGPMEQRPRPEGVLIGGFNPVCIDRVAANIMGFDYKKIPQIRESFKSEHWKLCPHREKDIIWKSNIEKIKKLNLHFVPTINWKNHIEIS